MVQNQVNSSVDLFELLFYNFWMTEKIDLRNMIIKKTKQKKKKKNNYNDQCYVWIRSVYDSCLKSY